MKHYNYLMDRCKSITKLGKRCKRKCKVYEICFQHNVIKKNNDINHCCFCKEEIKIESQCCGRCARSVFK